MTITSKAPAQIVGLLKSKTSCSTGVLFGHYWMTSQGSIAAQVSSLNLQGKIFFHFIYSNLLMTYVSE